jgi:hypothetical protein
MAQWKVVDRTVGHFNKHINKNDPRFNIIVNRDHQFWSGNIMLAWFEFEPRYEKTGQKYVSIRGAKIGMGKQLIVGPISIQDAKDLVEKRWKEYLEKANLMEKAP